jgi:hypothetical protein
LPFASCAANYRQFSRSRTEHRTHAKAMLKVKGVNVAKPSTMVRFTPPRY